MRCGVVVRFSHAQAVHAHTRARQRCPRLGPLVAQPELAVTRGSALVLLVWVRAATAAQLHGVKAARQCQGQKQAHVGAGVGVLLRAPDARHQLATAYHRVGIAQGRQLVQRIHLASLIAVQRALQRLGIAAQLGLAPA